MDLKSLTLTTFFQQVIIPSNSLLLHYMHMLSKRKVLSPRPLKYKYLCTQSMTGFMKAEACSSSLLALKTLFCLKLHNSFGSYRCAKSPVLAGMGFLCIGYRGPCQCLSSAGCGALLFSECSSTSLGCLLMVASALLMASDVQACCF